MATPTITIATTTVGAIYTKDYGTVKFDWTIGDAAGYELVSVGIVRAQSNNTIFPAKTVTLSAGLGFNPIDTAGSWTDTGLALTKDISSNETTTYTFTLTYVAAAGANATHSPTATSVVIPHLNAIVTSPSEDYCTDECWDFASKKAYAAFEGKASLDGENGTILSLVLTTEAGGGPLVTDFITDSSVTPGNGGTVKSGAGGKYIIGTSGITTDALATQALHVAFSAWLSLLDAAGFGDEELIYSISPASYTDETLVTLFQPTVGADGNTEITGTMSSALHINGMPFNKDATVYTGFKGGRTGSDLGVSLGGYFENPLTQRSSFDINYCLNNPNSDGIGDAEFYLDLPKEANITSFVPNSIISSSDVSVVKAFEGAPEGMSNRWKVNIAYPGSGAVNFGQGSPSSSTKATALFAGKLAINGDTGKKIVIQNTDGSLITFTTAAVAPSASTATTIGTTGASTDVLATEAFHTAFAAAISAGTLKATLTPAVLAGNETSLTLTQDIVGTIGNTTFTHTGTGLTSSHLYINGAAWTSGTSAYGDTTATTAQTAGAPANAYAVFEPQAALEDDNNTTLSIFNNDWSYAFFKTNSGTSYTASYDDDTFTVVGTDAADTTAKATESLHIAFTEAIASGKLKSHYLLPKVYTASLTSITLINKTAGSAGNKRLVGNIDDSSLDVNGFNFLSGFSTALRKSTFIGGADMPPLESHDVSKLLPPSYGKFGTVYIDKPLGDGFISFDTENTRVQVVPEKLPSLYLTFDSNLLSSGAYSPTVTTLSGTPVISNSTYKWGAGSLSLDGSSGLNIPDTTGATDLDGDFTIDFWFYHSNISTGRYFLIGSGGTYGSTTANQWALSCKSDYFTLDYNSSGTWYSSATAATTIGWNHIAIIRSGNEVEIYFNGLGPVTITSNISTMSFDYSGINIGQPMTSAPAGHGSKFEGYIDGFRVSKGIVKWTKSFDKIIEHGSDLSTTNAIYDGTGNMNNKKGSVVFGQVRDSSGVVDVGSSFDTINRSSTDYFWLPIDTDHSPDNIWQTGPPLSKCVDEVNIGYGDHSYSLKAFDSNTFDIEYCLKTDEMDTFIILCAMTDFKTKIAAVEKQFGDAADNGWDLNFKNLSPGFGIIYGHGTKKIKPSGMGTLLRVYLDSPLIQQNPSTDPDTSVCTYPAFLNLGENNYRQFQQYISEVDTESATRLLDSNSSLWTQLSGDFQWDGTVLTSDRLDGSGIVKELRWLAWGSDPRLGSVATTLADNIERVLKEYSTDAGQEAVISSAVAAGHYFRIFFMVYLNLIRTLPSVQEKLDFTWSKLRDGATSLCDFSLSWSNPDYPSYGDYCSSDDNELVIYIYYNSLFSATSGIEIDFIQLKTIIDASNGVALSDTSSWGRKKYNLSNSQLDGSGGGDSVDQLYVGAYDGEFIQAYNDATGKYLAVYDAQILSQNIQTLNNPYLQNTSRGTSLSGQNNILTTIVLDVTGGCSNIGGTMDDIVAAINTDLATAKLVGNEIIAKPSSESWTGESYTVGDDNSLDIKDFLTTAMFATGGIVPSTDLTETKIESVFKLPKSALKADGTHKTVKQYYNIANLDLTGASYPSDDLKTIDADGDGKIDILDVVALRNTWVLKDEYPTTSSASVNSGLSVVPTEKCVSVNSDINLLLPTNCSTFCVTPSCFAKVWISDLIAVYSEEDAGDGTARIPEKYLAEVSYSVDCKDDGGKTVEDFSGVQFKLEGVKRNGILRTENGADDGRKTNATAVKIANWTEHLVNSTVDEDGFETKDTYFAYSVTGDYISKGSGVLCYLSLPSDSMLNADESMARESFLSTTTNKAVSTFSNSIEGVTYPLANIRFKSFHIDELEIFEKFGLRVSNTKITSNRSYDGSGYYNMALLAVNGWIGWNSGSPATVTEANIKTALAHAATGIYNVDYDSDDDKVVDIADIQALAHLLYVDEFNFVTNYVTPKECCPYVAPSIPNLVLVDFKDGTIPLIVEGAKNTIEIDIDGNELDCTSALSGHEGGIFLHWNPVDNADYYIVYRQEANKKAIPIIATAPGGTRAYLKDFSKRERGYSNMPTQVATTTWIDFPPALTSGCLDYSKGGSSAAAPPGSSGVVDDTLSKYKYWVDAINKDGQTTSHKIIGSAVSCRYAPTCTDFNVVVKSDSTHYGEFQAAHPFAPAPIGGCYSDSSQSASGDCLPLWVFAQNSQTGDGHKPISDMQGTITTEGRMPNSQGLGGKNKLGFSYISKKGFVGEDKFRYTAIVKDSENPNNIELWCRSEAVVSVYVKPKSPVLTGLVEPCCSDDEGKIKLNWASVDGAESYFVYKSDDDFATTPTKVSTITDDGSKDVFEYKEEPTEYTAFKAGCDEDPPATTPLNLQYKVSATKYMSGTTYESDSNVVDLTLTCCTPLANPTITSSLRGFCDKPLDVSGIVTLTLSAIAGADYYNIYRRGSYTGSSSDPFEFVGRAEGTLEFEDHVQGCIGCPSTNVKYDYYAVSMQEEYPDCNTEGNIATVTINCCNTAPVAYDQSLEVDYETELSDQILDAIDPEGNISSYAFAAVSSGTLVSDSATGEFSFTPDDKFYTTKDGTVTFTWTVTDDCSTTSNTGTVTITVKSPPECLEYDYIICNANIPWLTDQQDTPGVRLKISSLEQVPFMLNIKGVPSLRRYYGAYTMTAVMGGNSNTTIAPLASIAVPDDGFVFEPVFGCMDSTMFNYNPDAEVQRDGDCQPFIYGCTDPTASNYNPLANTSDNVNYPCDFGPAASVLFHFNGTPTEECSSDVTATGTFAYDSSGKFLTNAAKFVDAVPATPGDALFHFDGNFNDSVSGGSAASAHGTVTTSTTSVLGGSYGNQAQFTGASWTTANWLVIPDPEVGEGSFTIEFFLKRSASNYGMGLMGSSYVGSSTTGAFAMYAEGSYIYLGQDGESNVLFASPIGGWGWNNAVKHVALVREVVGTVATWYFYIDGVSCSIYVGNRTTGVMDFDAGSLDWNIGTAFWNSNNRGMAGTNSVDEVRISKSIVYPSGTTFNKPTAPFPAPSAGSPGGSDFHINTSNPTAIDNTNSLYWDGEFIFDMWVKIDDVGENGTIFKPDSADAGAGMFGLEWLGEGAWKLLLGSSTELTITDTLVADTWYHVAVVRDGDDDIRFYRDGVGKDMRDTGAGALYNLNSNLTDDIRGGSGLGTLVHQPSDGGDQWKTNWQSIGTAFGTQLRLKNAAYWYPSQNSNNSNHVSFPDPDLGTGAFTIEFFFDPVDATTTNIPWLSNGVNVITNTFALWAGNQNIRITSNDGVGEEAVSWNRDWVTNHRGSMHHWALCRSAAGVGGSGNSTWTLFINGAEMPYSSGHSGITRTSNYSGQPISLGTKRASMNAGQPWYMIREGVYDSVRITKSVLYTTASTPAPPTAPLTGGGYPTADGYEFTTTIDPNAGTTGVSLYLFEDGNSTITDSVGSNHGSIVGTPDWSYTQYVTNAFSIENIDAGGWGDQIQFANDSGALNYAAVPNPSFGTGAFTLEFWHCAQNVDVGDGLCGFITGGSVDSFMVRLGSNINSSPKLTHTIPSGTNSDDYLDATYNYDGNAPAATDDDIFVHWAIVRTAESGGNQEWRLYINGDHRGSLTKEAINTDSAGDFLIGYNLRLGLFDSFRISKSELYFGTDPYTIPTGPFSIPAAAGYEVGGASDTQFEGSIDELRIVKDDSEEPTMQTDEYDCS